MLDNKTQTLGKLLQNLRTNMSKTANDRLRDHASWLPLAAEWSLRYLAFTFYDMSVYDINSFKICS